MHSIGLMFGLQFHFLFVLLLLVGAVLFIVWMAKFAKKEELKNSIIGLIVVGLLGCLISSAILSKVAHNNFAPLDSGFEMMMEDDAVPYMMNQ